VNYIREAQKGAGVQGAAIYGGTMYILAGMLVLGLICNALVGPLDKKWFMSDAEVAALQAKSTAAQSTVGGSYGIGLGQFDGNAILAWAIVGIPILWGVWITLQKTIALF
jgi:hypothetical protein